MTGITRVMRVCCSFYQGLVKRRLGLSLMETVIASFLLLCSLLVVINLFHSAFGYMARVENHQLAAMLAERQMERMRIWSETPNGNLYNYDNPGLALTYNGQTNPATDYPDFSIATNVTTQALYSPCSDFELPIAIVAPLITRRHLPQSASKVQVTISWNDHGPRQLLIGSIFSKPALQWANANCVTIPSSPPNPLAQGSSSSFTAQATDNTGAPINDVFFSWQISPINGTGTLSQARDGSVAQLINQIYVPPYLPSQTPPYQGLPAYTGGQCYVQAVARYHGRTVITNSTVVNLQ